jgi:hypothetical protein
MSRPNRGVPAKYCLVWLLFSLVANFTWAQSETATVSGQVADPSGLNITGAQVKLVDIDRDTSTIATTSNAGLYMFPSVRPGRYRMEVRAPGFKVVDITGLTVNVQDHLEQNFKLVVGSISESMTVTADASNVNTTDGTVSTVVDRNFAENLPMNGRSFQTLIQLTPGVVAVPSNSEDSGQFSVNGQRAASNYWMVDGVSANIGIGMSSSSSPGNGMGGTLGSFSASGGTNSLVSVDAMQEFRIQTSTFAPEFGRTPGAQISIVTRSGTNAFHGALFDYLRNDVLDANDWFNGYTNTPALPKAKERQNDFGGTFSGPILTNRTFFFFSYEGLRLRLPETSLSFVPCDSSCEVAGNVRATAAPPMQPYLNAYPRPNGPEILCDPANDPGCPPAGTTGSAQFNASYSDPSTLDAYSLRIDHKLADKINLFGRYDYSPSQIVQRGGGLNDALSVLQTLRMTTQTATAGATWSASPTFLNDLRCNYSSVHAAGDWLLDNFAGAIPLPVLPFPSGFSGQNGSFELFVNSLGTNSELTVGQQAENVQRQINLVDSLSVQKGSHSIKLGVDYRRLSPRYAPAAYQQSTFFADMPSAESGNSKFGTVSSSDQVTLLFRNLGAFVQDTWHVNPRMNLTYGLRWDVDFAPSSLNGPSIPAVTGYNLTNFSQLAIAPPGTPPFKTTYGNFAPRLGAAYQLSENQDWGTVIRGGVGVFYDLVSSETGTILGVGDPPFGATSYPVGTFPFGPIETVPPAILPTGTLSSLYAFNPRLKLPYTLEWNVAFEQTLGRQQTLSASYVGATGRRLVQTNEVIAPPTNPVLFPGIFIDNTAVSSYNALQIQLQRRLSRGLQALASYTWSHSIDTGSAGSNILASNGGVPGSPNANRGPSDFDIRNAASAGLTYTVPSLSGSDLANAILSGWSTENIIQARSAPPVDISDQNFFFFNGGIFADIRPDLVPGQPIYLYGSQYPGGKAFNPAAFTNPPINPSTGDPLRQGNVSRNLLRGFGMAQWDFAVHRDFPIHESLKLQFRAEMFNVLNHPNFGQPSGMFATPLPPYFGLATQTLAQGLNNGNLGGGAFNPLYQMGGPRSIQFALKLMF